MRILVAVPALNEAEVLGRVLESLSSVQPLRDVVVVDDGSRDATAQIARTAGARVISHAINLGVGAAMGTAFMYAARAGYDVVVQFDGDGQHRPEHYPADWLGDTVESIVLATRQGLRVREVPVGMDQRAGGAPSQSIFRATLYTARILFILGLATIRSVPPQLRGRRLPTEVTS